MRQTNIVRTLALILPLACSFALPLAAQDSQDTSVAEAARRAREQKKASAKPAPVITNDTLTPAPSSAPATTSAAPAPGAASGTPAGQQPSAATSASGDTSAQSAPSTPEDVEQKKKEVEDLKQQLAALQGDVDFVQRSLALDQDAFYSKPDFSHDRDGKAKLDAEQTDLKQKQDTLAQLKAKLADLGVVEEPKTPAPPAKP